MYEKVLAAVNEFTNSEITARYAIALAKSCKAELSLVFVAEDRLRSDIFRQAESALARLFIEAEGHNIDVKSIIEKGNPLKKISDIVKQNKIEIVFTSTRRDAARTAVAISKQIGLVKSKPVVLEGHELENLSDDSLEKVLRAEEIILARMSPRHKMRIVSILKDGGERVAVTGDGVNDAPALKRADIGISMGIMGTDVAREAADMVLLDDNFATIVNAVEEGRTIFENIKKFITYIFAHGTPEAIPYIAFALFKIPLPLTVMQILAIDLGTETVPALALGGYSCRVDPLRFYHLPSLWEYDFRDSTTQPGYMADFTAFQYYFARSGRIEKALCQKLSILTNIRHENLELFCGVFHIEKGNNKSIKSYHCGLVAQYVYHGLWSQ